MSPMTATRKHIEPISADDYLATAATRPRWTELINGEVHVNSPTVRHQELTVYIQTELILWMRLGVDRGRSAGQIDMKLNDRMVLAPDVWWAGNPRFGDGGAFLDGAPDLAVEVRSPSTWRFDTGIKLRAYESAGVHEVWLVDTEANSVIVHRRSPGSTLFDEALEVRTGDVLTTPLLPGFHVDITTLFDR
jgi:Uma2 family endonuclease